MAHTTKSIEDFKKAHDPSYQNEYVGVTYHRDIKWKKTQRAIVVAAQNATPVHEDFWKILTYMASELNAELLVIPMRYKNPTSLWTGSQQNAEWYAPEVRPFLWNVSEDISDKLKVLGDIKIQPTNSNPVSGAEALSHSRHGIIAHTRAQSKSVPLMAQPAKMLMTSGAVTVANYTDTRAGRLGHFHHSLSAILVEIGNGKTHLRRLNYVEKTQRVIDMGIAWYADHHETAPPSLALVMGDTHVDYVDDQVVRATFSEGGIVERTRPRHLVWHDLLDGHSCNPHHENDPFADIAKYYAGRSIVSEESSRAIDFVHERTQESIRLTGLPDLLSVIVPSNHIDFLRRYIMKKDWKTLPAENRIFYLRTALHMAENTKLTARGIEYPDPFTELFRTAKVPNAIALDLGASFRLADVELAMHGDSGPNGAKGSRTNLRRVATKSVIGHSHSPGEDEGCTQVGTSTRLQLEYNGGSPSSWLHAHCDLNVDGKRQLVIITEGEFCL